MYLAQYEKVIHRSRRTVWLMFFGSAILFIAAAFWNTSQMLWDDYWWLCVFPLAAYLVGHNWNRITTQKQLNLIYKNCPPSEKLELATFRKTMLQGTISSYKRTIVISCAALLSIVWHSFDSLRMLVVAVCLCVIAACAFVLNLQSLYKSLREVDEDLQTANIGETL